MGQINIEVTHLNFSYEKENPILKDISFAADGLRRLALSVQTGQESQHF